MGLKKSGYFPFPYTCWLRDFCHCFLPFSKRSQHLLLQFKHIPHVGKFVVSCERSWIIFLTKITFNACKHSTQTTRFVFAPVCFSDHKKERGKVLIQFWRWDCFWCPHLIQRSHVCPQNSHISSRFSVSISVFAARNDARVRELKQRVQTRSRWPEQRHIHLVKSFSCITWLAERLSAHLYLHSFVLILCGMRLIRARSFCHITGISSGSVVCIQRWRWVFIAVVSIAGFAAVGVLVIHHVNKYQNQLSARSWERL